MEPVEVCFKKFDQRVIIVERIPSGVDQFDIIDVLGIPGVVSYAALDIKSYEPSDIKKYGRLGRNMYAVTGKSLVVNYDASAKPIHVAAQIVCVLAGCCEVRASEVIIRSESEHGIYRQRDAVIARTVSGLAPSLNRPPAISLTDVMSKGAYPSHEYHIGTL